MKIIKKIPLISKILGDSKSNTQDELYGLWELRQYLLKKYGGEIRRGKLVHPNQLSN